MGIDKTVKRLNTDLSRMTKAAASQKKDAAAEKKALDAIAAQEHQIIDQFLASGSTPDAATAGALFQKLFALGQKNAVTKQKFDALVAKDRKAQIAAKKAALKDLKPAEYHLSLKQTNKDRKLLGLKALKKPVRDPFKPGSWKPGPGKLYGADTSSWQSQAEFERSIKGAKWSAIKATEGSNWNDPTFKARWNELGKKVKSGQMKLRMAYLFLQPGNAVGQAKHFLSQVGVHGKLKPGTRLALDWEGSAFRDPRGLGEAARYIHKVTGVWPVVYVQGSRMATAKRYASKCPIWEAAYGSGINRKVPFFQYSDGPGYDRDVFNGNLAALERFAGWK